MRNSEDELYAFDEKEYIEESEEDLRGCQTKVLYTLPRNLKSLIGRSFRVDSVSPPDLIESLGYFLGITDYETNMASFWFLDTVALQVLRRKENLGDHYLAVLISWLIGELTLIRDEKYSRKEFFDEMKNIFEVAAAKISEENQLPYWDEIVKKEDEEEAEEAEEARSKQFPSKNESASSFEGTNESSNNIDPRLVLDNVIESTYETYANELRYALIYAVFVESVELQSYQLPFVLRTPRPVKFAEPTISSMPFPVQLLEKLKQDSVSEKSKKPGKEGKGSKMTLNLESPDTPPVSPSDEEMLRYKRQFILPLLEANESPDILKTYTEHPTE